jgi:hypothetical protein
MIDFASVKIGQDFLDVATGELFKKNSVCGALCISDPTCPPDPGDTQLFGPGEIVEID